MFNFASLNHEILAFLKSQSTTLDHFLFQTKLLEANLSQNFSGDWVEELYNSNYFLFESIV